MAGNVTEWVFGWYHVEYYATLEDGVWDPSGPPSGSTRVMRGGAFNEPEQSVRCAVRQSVPGDFSITTGGFRVAMIAD